MTRSVNASRTSGQSYLGMGIRKSRFGDSAGGAPRRAVQNLFGDTDVLDVRMGFQRYEEGPPRVGWLINFRETAKNMTAENPGGESEVELYFLDEEGDYFKCAVPFDPYFLVKCRPGSLTQVDEYLRREHSVIIKNVEHQVREDLGLPNHLIGVSQPVLKLCFHNCRDLLTCRRALKKIVNQNTRNAQYRVVPTDASEAMGGAAAENILDVNEEDVPYAVRVFIDLNIRAGRWYRVTAHEGTITLDEQTHMLARPDPVVFAFDIEAAKEPLMFPDPESDQITMISFMVDGRGYLITNRAYVSKDIESFDFTPKPEYPGEFEIFNELNEKDTLERFFAQIREERPTVLVTFNGDFFDWPYIEQRAAANGLSMFDEIGFCNVGDDTYSSPYCCHLDVFAWVKRDSYLPQGSQNLKDVTRVKLGYSPHELDPEEMTPFAKEKPQKLAEYSVSDAVATYYLYMKYVHPFIFSLCTILPLKPDDVLRKGTGTLCEMLLMVQAYEKNILLPHKHSESTRKFYDGHLLESETYSGGHVECLDPGVFRNDLCYDFRLHPPTVQKLIDELGPALKYTIENDAHTPMDKIEDFDKVMEEIARKLTLLRDTPVRNETPYIYHLDVASMYPNIMTTNRLQPDSMVTEETCEGCHFHQRDKTCARKLAWKWRGEYYNATPGEYRMIEQKLRTERFPVERKWKAKNGEHEYHTFDELPYEKQNAIFRERVKAYSRTAHRKIKTTEEKEIDAIVCQRENPFYINTVRDFKDRRINFKQLQKQWKQKVEKCETVVDKEEAKKMVILYDSMQLAHKVILNSFYGYVKRTGSRWYSAEMAGVTCYTGAKIIQEACDLVKGLGRPLELDTDGIWCILPGTFPADVKFKLKSGGSLSIEYPGVILNYMVYLGYTNTQYQTLKPGNNPYEYAESTENSIFFEVDGPYKAMILPTSLEEGVNIKKRYAVFELDGTLSELKGFELKRRGELEIVKKLQGGLFAEFLKGSTLEASYAAAANRAGSWLGILESKGKNREDSDLLGLISEEKSLSKALVEYGSQKSTTITTAKRIAEFLGAKMIERKGLNARYVIAKYPRNAPVTERAIPVAIFNAPQSIKSTYLKKWLVSVPQENYDLRNIIDWDYYTKRLQGVIQKIITIPAALQKLPNPLPRVEHPPWLNAVLRERNSTLKQQKMTGYFGKADKGAHISSQKGELDDIEDFVGSTKSNGLVTPKRAVVIKRKHDSSLHDSTDFDPNQNSTPPDFNQDYGAWLRFQKRIWDVQREQRRNRARLFGQSSLSKAASGIKGMILERTEKVFSHGSWNILNLSPTSSPGQVKANICVNGRIQTVKLNVPRKVFVNFAVDPSILLSTLSNDISIEKVNCTLPGGSNSPFLYQFVMEEMYYARELMKGDCIFKNASVLGVYETQIEPYQRALLELGNVCTLDDTRPGLLGKGLENGFDLSSLRALSGQDNTYLDGSPLDFIDMQYFEINNQNILVLLTSWSTDAHVIQYASGTHTPDSLKLGAVYMDEVSQRDEIERSQQPFFAYQASVEFEAHTVSDIRRFYSKAASLLVDLQAQKATRTMLIVEAARPQRLAKLIRPMDDIPFLEVSWKLRKLPSVGWQSALAKHIIRSYLTMQSTVSKMLAEARFANVPLGNLPEDGTHWLIDILYARQLMEQRNILWWSPTPLPDYGGAQSDLVLTQNPDVKVPVINNKGIYAEVCVDIDVSNFPVNTILTSNIQGYVDGVNALADVEVATGIPFLRDAFSPNALAALNSLVREWWAAVKDNNEAADLMIQHFYAWVSTPASKLYDPRLFYHVENLSKGIFMQLVSVVQRLGYSIVMATRNRLVLGTNKSFFGNAFSAGKAIIEGIKQYKPKVNENNALFTYLDMNLQQHWDYLIWLDSVNYCGRVTSSDLNSESQLQTEHISEWQLAEYLPEILNQEFHEWALQFMQMVGAKKDEISSLVGTGDGNVMAAKSLKSANDVRYFASGILDELLKPLLARVKQLNRRYLDAIAHDEMYEFELPKLAGTRPYTGPGKPNPILDFIKDICAVYGLDKNLEGEFLWLQKRLLEVLRIGEFEPRAQFMNPAEELVLTNVVCDYCSYVTDIDICQPERPKIFGWHCHSCGHEYNRVHLEECLIGKLMKQINVYQTQDLRCMKCHRIRADPLSNHCPCSGSYENTIPARLVQQQLGIYHHVADFFGLRFLQEAVAAVSL